MSTFDFNGKTALVTGASSGIGEAFATHLARQHCNLVVVARRADRLDALKARLEAAHGITVTVVAADLADAGAPERIFAEVQARGVQVDVLINNAGLGHHGAFLDVPASKHHAMLTVNINALTLLTHLYAEDMKARGQGGAILLVASVAAYMPIPDFATYAASKSYVLSLGHALNRELKAEGIKVTVLSPGGVATEFMDVAGQRIDDWRTAAIMSPDQVAAQALAALAKGKAEIIPGLLNRASMRLLAHAPTPVRMTLGQLATH